MDSAGIPIQTLITAFGPIGFGLVATLLLWHFIVRPQLNAMQQQQAARESQQSARDAQNATLVGTLTAAVTELRAISESNRATAKILERLTIRQETHPNG